MQDLVRQLKYIQSVAREGSISAAALSESISASSILLAIDKFEHRFKTQLFVRLKSKGLRLTADGRSMIKQINRFLDEVYDFEEDMKKSGPSVEGELSVGIYTTVSAHIAPFILHSLSLSYPDLSIHLRDENHRQVLHDLRNGFVDVALTFDRFVEDDFTMVRMLKIPPHVILAETDPLAQKERVSILDLTERPLILTNTPEGQQYIKGLFGRFGVHPNVLYRTVSYETVRSSAALGLGVGIANLRPLTDLTYSGKRVVHRPLVEEFEPLFIAAITRRDDRLSRRTAAFVEHCRSFAQSEIAKGFSVH